MFVPPSAGRTFFKCAPPNLKSWIRPCIHIIFYRSAFNVVFISMQCCISLIQYVMNIEDANKFNNTEKLNRNDGGVGQPSWTTLIATETIWEVG